MKLKEMDLHRLGRVVMTEEMLDDLAERFQGLMVRGVTSATFEQYTANPDYYDTLESALDDGMGLHRDDHHGGWLPVVVGGMRRAAAIVVACITIGVTGVIPDRDWSIRCGSGMAQVGDSELYVREICSRSLVRSDVQWTPAGNSDVLWLNKGAGDFVYRLRFINGRLDEILRLDRGWSR